MEVSCDKRCLSSDILIVITHFCLGMLESLWKNKFGWNKNTKTTEKMDDAISVMN